MESPRQICDRLRRLAGAEAEAVVASGRADAVGLTGSASSGQVWPSSDVDILYLSDGVTEREFHWTVREGTILHGVITPWKELEAFREWYPARMIEAASWEWILDATWAMDGLVAMAILRDSAGRLAAMQTFMREHRFAPEVVRGRRPALLARARKEQEAGRAAEADRSLAARWHHHHAVDMLGIVWLEAGRRITSHKELEPALDATGLELGVPDLARLFRRAEGVDALAARREAVEGAFAFLLEAYSAAIDALFECYPTREPDVDRRLADLVYVRHVIQSVPHALARGCILHLAGVRQTLEERDFQEVPREAAARGCRVPVAGEDLAAAARAALASLPLAPVESRHAAFAELLALTSRL